MAQKGIKTCTGAMYILLTNCVLNVTNKSNQALYLALYLTSLLKKEGAPVNLYNAHIQ